MDNDEAIGNLNQRTLNVACVKPRVHRQEATGEMSWL
jgi:hypothetical protein